MPRAPKPTRAGAIAPALVLVGAVAIAANAAVIQQDNLRITVLSQIPPYKLPRTTSAPIAVFIAGHLATPSGECRRSCRR